MTPHAAPMIKTDSHAMPVKQKRTLVTSFILSTTMMMVLGCERLSKETTAPLNRMNAGSTQVIKAAQTDQANPADDLEARIVQNCGQCHAYPRPETMTMRTWEPGIRYMFELFKSHYPGAHAGLTQEQVMGFYRRHSAKKLAPPTLYPELGPTQGLDFKWRSIPPDREPSLTADLVFDKARQAFLTANMLSGKISLVDESKRGIGPATVLSLKHPTRMVRTDINGDGHPDLLVADLGIFAARDTHQSRLMARLGGPTKPDVFPLLSGRSRITDMLVHDFDGDGQQDIAVAEFGWQSTGGVYVLLNQGLRSDGRPEYQVKQISQRAGAVALGVGAFDGRKEKQLVVAYAQHDEKIVIYSDVHTASPTSTTVFTAHTPLWGLLSMLVVDVDDDGDLDIVHVNGDALDAPKLATFQGVHLLENTGHGKFKPRTLAQLPGAHSVNAGDFDGDGRTDLLAASNLPPGIERTLSADELNGRDAMVPIESVLLLRQTGNGEFTPLSVRRNDSCFARVVVGDWDSDGDLDAALGSFGLGWQLLGENAQQPNADTWASCAGSTVVILENQRKSPPRHTPSKLPLWRSSPSPEARLSALSSIIRNDPKDAANRINLGGLLTQVGQTERAIKVLNQARLLKPKEKAIYLNLSIAHDVRGQFKLAEENARQALRIDPSYGDALQQHAITLAHLGQFNRAINTLEQAIKNDPKNATYRMNLGTILATGGRYTYASKLFESVLKIEPNHRRAQQYLRRAQNASNRAHRRRPDPRKDVNSPR